jgi:arylsulfatase A-like enzyme
MTARGESFLAALTSLWLRLSTMSIVALLFLLALQLPPKLAGWSFYLRPPEVAFEVAVFAVFTALSGVALGALCAAAVAPFLFYCRSSRRRIVEAVTAVGAAGTTFLCLTVALTVLLKWAHVSGILKTAIVACYLIAFALAVCIPRGRKQLAGSLDDYLGEKATRRAVIGTGIAAAALVAAEAAMGKMASAAVIPKRVMRPSGPNILLVTFDAFSAEDMSLYGYRLPTTPNIEEFARNSSVFTHLYSGSTFTTPCVATMLTGQHPSEHHVYQLEGRFRRAGAAKTLPRAMRSGGYSTGASISNPFAYFLAQGIAEDYDALPEPAYDVNGFRRSWDALGMLHQRQPFGTRTDEFFSLESAWDSVPSRLEKDNPRLFARSSGYPPAGSFEQAREILGKLPDGFFLWVHLFAPHAPYLPDKADSGRFLPGNEMRTETDQAAIPVYGGVRGAWPLYRPSEQGLVDKTRLRYDEFVADADRAFGAFLSGAEEAGRLRNTAVIVSADHGESFEGGLLTHGSRFQTRPEIHIPLIIRLPGQERGARVAVTADQTSLAPTILEIAGLPRPDWMRGPSLLPWLNRNNEGEGQGLAFTQYLATNSSFKPVTHGTVGVIDGRHQYVLDLDTGKGILRPLAEAQSSNLDRSAENPTLAQTLREAIYTRFPDLPRKPA